MICKLNKKSFYKRISHNLLLVVSLLFVNSVAICQTNKKERTVVQKAHYKQWDLKDFTESNNNKFKVKLFTIEDALVNTSHHWFLQVLTQDNLYVNYGKVKMIKGYWKNDKDVKFEFMNPIFSLCNEGKFIIGFVNVKKSGRYILELEIENFGNKDIISVELEIKDQKTTHS